jgi:hypothetical protein
MRKIDLFDVRGYSAAAISLECRIKSEVMGGGRKSPRLDAPSVPRVAVILGLRRSSRRRDGNQSEGGSQCRVYRRAGTNPLRRMPYPGWPAGAR